MNLAELAAKFRALSEELPGDLTELAVDKFNDWMVNQVRQGKSPDGTKWPNKKDGEPALRGAEKAVSVYSRGTSVFIKVDLPYAYHKKRRRILPTGKEPELLKLANESAQEIVDRWFQ